MTTVKDILDFLNTIAPPAMQEHWDNVGLLCGSAERQVTKIFVALDPFKSVCREAEANGADLLVTHHPLIFQPAKAITDATGVGRAILFLASHGISAINAHTNLDCAPGGVNDTLARTLGLRDIEVVNPNGVDAEGRPWGLLRMGAVEEMALPDFLAQVKKVLGTPCLKYVDGGKKVTKVAVGGGACGGEWMDAVNAGCDTFITSDLRYNQFWEAKEAGLTLIDAGHFHTENPVCGVLAEKLREAFPHISVVVSQNHTDCANFY